MNDYFYEFAVKEYADFETVEVCEACGKVVGANCNNGNCTD